MLRRTTVAAFAAAAGGLALAAGSPAAFAQQADRGGDGRAAHRAAALMEARALMRTRAVRDAHGGPTRPGRFTPEQNVFLPSTIALRDLETPGKANATLPAFRGVGPDGRANVWYLITEAADYQVARTLGVNYAPKLEYGVGSAGSQRVRLSRGRLRFRGAVDFAPRRVLRGTPAAGFMAAAAQPGAVGDAQWSSLAVLPSGSAINVAAISNPSGDHDRLISLDRARAQATLELLDGWQSGDRFYYHLVTDSSDAGAATIEQGIYTPRLGRLPRFGRSAPADRSALLAFSPNTNGETGADNPERQGLNSTILDGDRDPVNVFPLDPDNDKRAANNYSPMWDAHLSQWTDAAIAAGQRRAIRGFEDLDALVKAGLVESYGGSPGRPNPFVSGLFATDLIINCPVIAQPFERPGSDDDSTAFVP